MIVLAGVAALVFALEHVVPGGPARAALGSRASAGELASFDRANGYDRPVLVQLWSFAKNLVQHFDLGYSYQLNMSVKAAILSRIGKTVLLVGLATILALAAAIPVGVYQANRRRSARDHIASGLSLVLYATPDFVVGLLLVFYFAIDLHWFPAEAPDASTVGGILGDPRALVLPVLTLASTTFATFCRYMRSSMTDVLSQDYTRTARAKGASQRRVLYVHGLRNALLAVATLVGLSVPGILGGAVIVEKVFNYPGMGLLAVNAASELDIPTLLGTTLVATIATVAGSLVADLAYVALDPRIRYGRS